MPHLVRQPLVMLRADLNYYAAPVLTTAESLDEVPAGDASRPGARVLCLHGGGTNTAVLRLQTAKLRARMGSAASFEFLEGGWPSRALDPAIAKKFGEEGSYWSWYDVQVEEQNGRDYVECLLDPSVVFRYDGADAALARLGAHVDEAAAAGKPYDALLGFSQGAVLITLLTAMRLHPTSRSPPSWRANICVAGMPVRAQAYEHLFAPHAKPLEWPSVIAQGTKDPFFEWCDRLKHDYAAPLQVSYDEGHRFPHSRTANAELISAIQDVLGIEDGSDAREEGSVTPAAARPRSDAVLTDS